MAKKGDSSPPTARVQALVDKEVVWRMEEVLVALKRLGIPASVSVFVEIALRELLGPPSKKLRAGLPEIMRKHGATPRRDRD